MTTAPTIRTVPAGPGPVAKPLPTWPVVVLAAPAFVAVWSGWVGLGSLTGFGVIHPLPGTPLADWELDTAITLPIGVETYAAYALRVWLSGQGSPRAVAFARASALAALLLGAAGQVAYHLMAAPASGAPWWITTVVATLPVLVLGMGAALAHLVRAADHPTPLSESDTQPDNAPDTGADTTPETGPDTGLDTTKSERKTERRTPPSRKTPGSAGRRTVTAADRITRVRERHPDLPTAEIARRARVSERTVRRHLNGPSTTTGSTGTGPGTDGEPGTAGSVGEAA